MLKCSICKGVVHPWNNAVLVIHIYLGKEFHPSYPPESGVHFLPVYNAEGKKLCRGYRLGARFIPGQKSWFGNKERTQKWSAAYARVLEHFPPPHMIEYETWREEERPRSPNFTWSD